MDKLFYIGFFLAITSFLLYAFLKKRLGIENGEYFILFLFCMFFFDTIGVLFSKYGYNNAFYNLMSLIEFNLLFLFYRAKAVNILTKRVIGVSFLLYNVIYIFSSIYYGNGVFTIIYNTIAPVFGAALIGVVLMLYLREFLLSEKILNYKKNIYFWITTGLLLYYLGTMPLTAIFNFMKPNSSFLSLYKIQYLLTIIMHSCFLIGLLWSWKKVK